jgi:small-conductance mechanosensitive channel
MLGAWRQAFADLIEAIPAYLPILFSALLLLLTGWVLAFLARAFLQRVLTVATTRLTRNRTISGALERTGFRQRVVWLVAAGVFWIILFFFVALAAEKLQLTVLTAFFNNLASYLPRLLLGAVIVLAGFLAGNLAYSTVSAAAASAGVRDGNVFGRAVQILLFFMGFVVGAEQVGIQSTLLTVMVAIIFGTAFGGAALAFGLGSGLAASNIISAHYLMKTYRPGQTVRIGPVEGRILEITRTDVILETAEGQVLVPARKFSEEASVLITREAVLGKRTAVK